MVGISNRSGFLILLAAWCLSIGPASYSWGDPTRGTLKGRVIFLGAVSPAKKLVVKRDPNICGKTITYQPLLVDEASRGMRYVVLSLEGIDYPRPQDSEEMVTFANKDCSFQPRVQGAMLGQLLQLINKDPMLHNTHIRLEKRTFVNVAQVVGGRPIVKRLQDAGIMRVNCDKHKFMQGYLLTFDHRYFAVTNEFGEYELPDVPAGNWTLRIWHQTLGTLKTEVIVSGDKDTVLNMAYPES
ncbi:MAG: carboxypeptidase regulatory-like domain-containing protein [Nitrospirota bacterium]|nr:carboxypeptidase regulatory-like domain-containing protein [Nitrospirota bacterium]